MVREYLLQNSRFVVLFPVVSELDLDLEGREVDGVVHPDGMGAVQDGLASLLVEEVQLDGVAGVDVGVRVKVLALQEEDIAFNDALFAEGLAMVDPVN